MKRLPNEYLWFVERLIREYPDKLRERENLEEVIEACCRAPSIPDTPSCSSDSTEPERVTDAKLRNKHYQRLVRQIERIEEGFKTLTTEENEFVELYFWSRLPKYTIAEFMVFPNERNVWRMRKQILKRIAFYVIGDWLDKKVSLY